ncbi:MAG TPA: amidohydrolase [Cyclobacteriaceae bacterium]|nr:amidohydrolase [Cyclobacteriaceae bacterium]
MRQRLLLFLFLVSLAAFGQKPKLTPKKIDALKKEAADKVQANEKLVQVMVDKIFSFAELGFQEYESSKYLTELLKKNGFKIEMGIAGIPTAWTASWGSGKPVIALGSDVDCIPKASQKPGVAYHDPIVEGAPGHGEGHNSGIPLNIAAALAAKEIMEREGLSGTLVLWPGIAEELVGTKAYYTRDGYFDNVDMCLFTHVGSNLGVSYGPASGTGLISVEYTFSGESAHSAGAPWRGRSAADAVELMNIGWQYQREHLEPLQRSHSVITNGGDQPNVVPQKASIWYYFREVTYPNIMELYGHGNRIAEAAAKMTQTTVTKRTLGSAWPRHFNKPIAEVMNDNIKVVGLPAWSQDDQVFARAVQKEVKSRRDTTGMPTKLDEFKAPDPEPRSGGSDDIGDISWKVPTVTMRFPANIPGLPGHNWANAIAMATPIAHKGVTAGAKVQAMTIIDILTKPEITAKAWDYFKNEQLAKQEYKPMITAEDEPATYLNTEIMKEFRPQLEKYYYDETKYNTYLEQLGIKYPTLRK